MEETWWLHHSPSCPYWLSSKKRTQGRLPASPACGTLPRRPTWVSPHRDLYGEPAVLNHSRSDRGREGQSVRVPRAGVFMDNILSGAGNCIEIAASGSAHLQSWAVALSGQGAWLALLFCLDLQAIGYPSGIFQTPHGQGSKLKKPTQPLSITSHHGLLGTLATKNVLYSHNTEILFSHEKEENATISN